jgi:hypothetical protein
VRGVGFERFVGIDWSGAKGERQSGIQVFEVSGRARSVKQSSRPSGTKRWSRRDVFDFIGSLGGCRTLVGLDFAFSVPWNSSAGCIPACLAQFASARDLWEHIDTFCKDAAHYYGGPIWLKDESPFRPFIQFWSKKIEYKREIEKACLFRRTEEFAKNRHLLNSHSVRPASIYQLAGPQVGAGSFAGMRVLHALASTRNDVAIWPFDAIDKAAVVLVEIYPTLFYALAREEKRPTKDQIKSGHHKQVVRRVLEFWGVNNEVEIPSRVDAIDAMVSAAAIYSLSQQPEHFCIPQDEISAREGWIFGVPGDVR